MGLIERSFGSRLDFAVEFRVDPKLTKSAVELWGYLGLWAAGDSIGNPEVLELLFIAMDSLLRAAEVRSRRSSLLSNLPVDLALDVISWDIYGGEDPKMQNLAGSADLAAFDLLPTSAGPSFDQWQATLIEEGETERFIYRRDGEPAKQAIWKTGTFRKVVLQAHNELRGIAASIAHSGTVQ